MPPWMSRERSEFLLSEVSSRSVDVTVGSMVSFGVTDSVKR